MQGAGLDEPEGALHIQRCCHGVVLDDPCWVSQIHSRKDGVGIAFQYRAGMDGIADRVARASPGASGTTRTGRRQSGAHWQLDSALVKLVSPAVSSFRSASTMSEGVVPPRDAAAMMLVSSRRSTVDMWSRQDGCASASRAA